MDTAQVTDVALGGPLPLQIVRAYNTAARHRDVGLGPGWSHSFAWEVHDLRGRVVLVADDGTEIPFGEIQEATGVVGPHGWILGRADGGFTLGRLDDTTLVFGEPTRIPGGHSHRLLAVQDKADNRIRLRYRDGSLTELVDCVGRVVDVMRRRDGKIDGFRVPHPASNTDKVTLAAFRYDEHGDLSVATGVDGAMRSFTYDGEGHLMTSQTMASGLVFFYRYDRLGRCVETWGEFPGSSDPSLSPDVPEFLADHETRAKGIHHVKLTFGDGGYSEVVDSVSLHRYFGNRFGKCDKAVSSGGVFSRTFNENGHLVAFTDALDATTLFERDFRGRELRVIDPLGRTTTIHRYPGGAIREVIDAAGGVTKVTPSDDGLILVDPNGAMYTVSFGPRGLVRHRTAPDGRSWTYEYDSQGNLIEIVGPGGRRTSATYDGWGRCTSVRDPDGSLTVYEHSLGGHVVAIHEAGATTRLEYDGEGNVISMQDADGGVTRMTYSGLGRLHETYRPDGTVVRLKYDREGRLVEVHNARGEVHSIAYNGAGMRVRERTFDGRELRYQYDAMGRLTSSTNGSGARTVYERDLAGQLIRCIYADETSITYTYDALGEVVAATCPAGQFRFERNPVGWIVGEVQDVGGEAISVKTEYDAVGAPVARHTSLGHTAAFKRGPLGECASAILDGREEIRFAYDACGRETTRLLALGGRIDSEYGPTGALARRRVHSPLASRADSAGAPTWAAGGAPGTTMDRVYQYTATRELAAIWDSTRGITRFHYDALGRLLAVVPEQARAELFVYDANGNVTEGEAPDGREYDRGGRLLRKGDTTFIWNDAGQLVERRAEGFSGVEVTRYRWWDTGLLRSVERADGTLIEFAYDPWARRVSKLESTHGPDGQRRAVSSTRFVWDGVHLVHEIKRSAGAATMKERTYLFEDLRTVPIAHREVRTVDGKRVDRGWSHYLNDDSGAPEALVDSAGRVTCELLRTAWGEVTFAAGYTATTPLRFRGQYADEETGLSYNRHRYYDPAIGRYISADPIELLGGLNPFAYALDCPTSAVDVEGLAGNKGTSMLTVIRDASGTPVATGLNADPNAPKGPFNTGKGCAEVNALNAIAKPGESAADVKARMIRDKMTMETYQIQNNDRAQAQKKVMRNNEIPDSAKGVCPCGKCGNMVRGKPKPGKTDPPFGGPDMTSQVKANNREVPGGSMKAWNGATEFGS